MFDTIIGLLAPHMCLGCGVEGTVWCGSCQVLAPPVAERCYKCHAISSGGRTCATCRRNSPLYAVQAATRYEGHLKQLVWKLKFERAYAAAPLLANVLAARSALPAGSILAPVPTSTKRVRQRGYDQSVLLARAVARITKHRYSSVLIRLGQQQQHTASREQRLAQLHDAFTVTRPDVVNGSHIVLIDDVITTGATLESAARALKAAGAKRVSAVVFAQA